jgi:hypothetical protein
LYTPSKRIKISGARESRERRNGVAEKRTMTLNLTEVEMKGLEELSRRKDLSKTAVIRQALRLYQLIDTRLQRGEKLFFEDEAEKKKAEVMVV